MHADFKPIALEDQAEYRRLIDACPEPTSDYAFANLWGWAEHYGLEISFGHGLAWLRQTRPETVYWAPMGDWNATDWTEVALLAEPVPFIRVPEPLARNWGEAFADRIEVRENRDHFDYIYSVPDLTGLKGNKFHKKKNLLNQFKKKYDFEFHPMDLECVEDVLEMQALWYEWHELDAATLKAENRAISRVIKNFDRIPGLSGGSIKVDGCMIAYTVAEALTRDMLVIHFEKGDTRFKGVYQAINQMFLEAMGDRFELVNREQDMGEEGLRKAKESYNPVSYLKKYDVKFL